MTNAFAISMGFLGIFLFIAKNPTHGVSIDTSATIPMLGQHVPLVWWMAFLVLLCIFTVVANVARVAEMVGKTKLGLSGFIAHVGVAILMGGLIVSRGFERTERLFVQEGRPASALGYAISYKGISSETLRDKNSKAQFDIEAPDGSKFVADPTLYYFVEGGEEKPMTWPYIRRSISHDFYFALHPPITDAWSKPQLFLPGETRKVDEFTVTNGTYQMIGEPGQPGTKFVANAKISITEGGKTETYDVKPEIVLGGAGEGMTPRLSSMGDDYMVEMTRMDVATKGVELRIWLRHPLFPIDLYYKPLTGLVWLGMIILFIGGMMAAFYRRFRPNAGVAIDPEPEPVDDSSAPVDVPNKNAPIATAQS